MIKWLPILILLVSCEGGDTTVPTSDCIATLTWELPTQRLDGSIITLTDLSKVTIYMSEAPFTDDFYIESVSDVTNTMLVTWEVKNIAEGQHFFYLTVTDQDNNVSAYSNILGKVC